MPRSASSGALAAGKPAPPRRRRLLRLVRLLALLLLALMAVGYAVAPTIACWWLRGQLPWRAQFNGGGMVVTSTGPALDEARAEPELQVTIGAEPLRAIAAAASGWWLPPGLARSGQHAEGVLILPLLRTRPFTWQVAVGGLGDAPLACLRVGSGDLDRFLAAEAVSVLEVGGRQLCSCTYVVDAGRIEDDDLPGHPPLERRQRVVARGSIVLDAGGFHRVVRVRRLAGHAVTTFTAVPTGLRVACRVAIEEADADMLSLPLVGDVRPLLLKQLEIAANRGLEDGLGKLILPAWFPTGARVDVDVLDAPDRSPAPLPAGPL
jgi:hypothetical protein